MTTVSGVVVDVGSKTVNTRFGAKLTYDIKLDDGYYYKFGFKKPPVNVGDEVSFSYAVGKYGNEADINSVKITGASTGTAAHPSTAAATSVSSGRGGYRPFPIPPDHGDRAIVRQNALTNAREVVCKYVAVDESDLSKVVDLIIETAYKFEEYTSGQREVNAAEEIMKGGKVS